MRAPARNAMPVGMRLAAIGLALALGGCAVTKQAKPESVTRSGFLGDYSKLKPGDPEKGQALLRYVDTAADWKRYRKIIIDPVTYWGDDSTKLLPPNQQQLTDYFHIALEREFGQKLQIVDKPGAGAMRLQVAVTDASSAIPVVRTVSLVVPQARALNTLQYLATGSWAGAGSSQVEARITDSATGKILGEWVDRRVGGSHLKAAAQWQWGDVQNALDEWAKIAASRVSSWTSGAAAPGEALAGQ